MKILISTDSTADIPVSLREELGIKVVPLTIITQEREYQDGYDITPEEFYPILEASEKLPSSSQVTPYLYTKLFEDALRDGYTDIIHTTINSKGSASWQGAIQMREEFYNARPDARNKINIHIIDSLTYSMGYGWPVIQAARMAAAGSDVQAILDYINDWVTHSRIYFAPMNLRCVKKSGRVSAAAAFIGDAVGLKPIITFEDGESKITAKVRGAKKVLSALIELCKNECGGDGEYIIARGSDAALCDQFSKACNDALGAPPAIEFQLGCIITINSGADAVGIIFHKK